MAKKPSNLPSSTQSNLEPEQEESTQDSVTLIASHWEGPLPHPNILHEYASIDSSFPERIVRMAEEQSRHRRELERTITLAEVEDAVKDRLERRLGQIFATGLVVVVLGVVLWLGLNDRTVVASILAGTSIIGILTILVLRQRVSKLIEKPSPTASDDSPLHRS